MHVCGNHFIFVDELGKDPMPDDLAAELAKEITNPYIGVGADGLIRLSGPHAADSGGVYLRLLEPDGSESLSCGNGLLCAGHYLACQYGVKSQFFWTQIPTGNPVAVISGETYGRRWICLPPPEPLPSFLFCPEAAREPILKNGKLVFRLHSVLPSFYTGADKNPEVFFSASPVFIGEPHIVVHVKDLEPPGLRSCFFPGHLENKGPVKDMGGHLLSRIVKQMTLQYPGLFPEQINLMIACSSPEGDLVTYRAFERGNLRETMACGTGALACSAALGNGKSISVIPEMARRHIGAVGYTVIPGDKGWRLYGDPEILWEGLWMGSQQENALGN